MEWFARAGLILDVVGVVILFRFGWPQPNHDTAYLQLTQGPGAQDLAAGRRHRRFARLGLALVVLGFAGQFVGTFR